MKNKKIRPCKIFCSIFLWSYNMCLIVLCFQTKKGNKIHGFVWILFPTSKLRVFLSSFEHLFLFIFYVYMFFSVWPIFFNLLQKDNKILKIHFLVIQNACNDVKNNADDCKKYYQNPKIYKIIWKIKMNNIKCCACNFYNKRKYKVNCYTN